MVPRALPLPALAAIEHAMSRSDMVHVGGFIIVQWQNRFSSLATKIPHAPLETIIGTSTLAQVVARYRLIDDEWIEVLEEPSPS